MKMQRRAFLVGVSAIAVSLALPVPSMARFPRGEAPVFYGNPNTSISSITGAIAISRTSVTAPGFVYVSAAPIYNGTGAGISCTGTRTLGTGTTSAVAYEDLEFNWDFGDPSGTEIFTRPTDGQSVNANRQTGPSALYKYKNSSGTPYTITLTVRGKSGSGYISAVFTQTVTVGAFVATNGTRYIDSVNGNDAWAGTIATPNGSGNGPWASLANFNAFGLSAGFTGSKAAYFAQGSHITSATGITFGANGTSNWRLDSYVGLSGAGPNPIIEINSGSASALDLGNSSNTGTRDDFVISNIDFIQSGTCSAGAMCVISQTVSTGVMSNIYIDNCNFTQNQSSQVGNFMGVTFSNTASSTQYNWGFWGGSIITPVFTTGSGQRHCFFGGPNQGLFFVGTRFEGSGSSNNQDHHIYPETQKHSLYKWLTFGKTGAAGTAYQRNFCININCDNFSTPSTSFPTTAQYYLISECACTGVSGATTANTVRLHDLNNSDNNPNQEQFTNVVVERSALANFTGTILTYYNSAGSCTYRDNRCWNNAGTIFATVSNNSGIYIPSIYRNKIYVPSGATDSALGYISNAATPVFNTTDKLVYTIGGLSMVPGSTVVLGGTAVPSGFTAGTTYYVIESYCLRSETLSATFSTSVPDIQSPAIGTNVPVGALVNFTGLGLPTEFVAGTNYYIIQNTGGTIRVSGTRGGPAIQATTTGSGKIGIYCESFTLGPQGGPAIQATSTGTSPTLQCTFAAKPKTVTDNVIWDSRASPSVIAEVWSDLQTALSLYDRNQYWKAGATNSTNLFTDNVTAKNFTQWHGFAPPYFDANLPTGLAANVSVVSWPCYPSAPTQWSDFGA